MVEALQRITDQFTLRNARPDRQPNRSAIHQAEVIAPSANSSAMTTSGQKPLIPALIGRNRIPAPTAVPNRLMTQVESRFSQRVV